MALGLLFLAVGGALAWFFWRVFASQWRKAWNWNGSKPDFSTLLLSFFIALGGTLVAVLGLVFILAGI